jgi:hypothetical protein
MIAGDSYTRTTHCCQGGIWSSHSDSLTKFLRTLASFHLDQLLVCPCQQTVPAVPCTQRMKA